MPLKFCSVPACPNFAMKNSSRCVEHPYERQDDRAQSQKRGYNHAWKKVRAEQLKRFPSCQICKGRADTVHHIVAIKDGGPRLKHLNLMSVCKACHNGLDAGKQAKRGPYPYK